MKRRILYFIFVLFLCFTVSGCGGSFFEEDVLEIESITSKVEADGTTILKITYTDSTRRPDEFKIPKGAQGNGIKEMITTKDESGSITNVTISFTEESMDPVSFDVKDGVSISGVVSRVDETTAETYLVVLFSDGTESEPFEMPKGEEGNGFSGFDKTDNEDGSITYYFHFSKSEDVVITIPAPQKGDEGRGISSIIGSEENGYYVLNVKYTDGTTADPIYFNKPEDPNTWISTSEKPENTIGKNGDYCFDGFHKIIYVKENGIWNKVVSFEDSTDYYFVTFDLNDSNDGGVVASMPEGSFTTYVITRNTYFIDNGYTSIPIPIREGYKFLGWYRTKDVTVVNGAFTDLTPILSDLTLYAQWEKIVE